MQFFALGVVVFLIFIIFLLSKGLNGPGALNVSSTTISSKFILDQYSSDLTKLASQNKLDPVIGREKEIQRVTQILLRRTKNNPILLGKAGLGKTAIVEGLAQRIAQGKVPFQLADKRVLALELGNLVAGTKYRGEFEKRLQILRDEIIHAQRQIILFIDEVHSLAEAGEAVGAIDAADILKPALAKGDLQVIGATTVEDYKQYIQNDKTLARRFQPILIEEPTPEQTLAILRGLRPTYEKYHGVKISDAALAKAVDIGKVITNRSFPDKAIDVIDEACAKVSLTSPRSQGKKNLLVTPKDVEEAVKQWFII